MRQIAMLSNWLPRPRRGALLILLLAGFALLLTILLGAPELRRLAETPAQHAAALRQQVRSAPGTDLPLKDRLSIEKDLLQYEQQKTDNWIKIGTAKVQAAGAVVLAAGGYFAWRNFQVAQRNLRATQDKLDIDREAQITNRFTQAIGQLGAELKDGEPNLEVRLGGIYALERIAKDSPRDYWPIMEVLTAYVRRNAPWPPAPPQTTVDSVIAHATCETPRPRTDIQAILTVLGRRTPPKELPEPSLLNLRDTDLRGSFLYRAHLERASLGGAHLESANLTDAHLEGATLSYSHLESASLALTHLEGAYLGNAYLEGARLESAHLEGATLLFAHLERTIHLTQAQVASAFKMGEGAHLPPDWPETWRDRFRTPQPQTSTPAPTNDTHMEPLSEAPAPAAGTHATSPPPAPRIPTA